MGVKITSREYFNPNTAGVSDWLIGNTGDWQKLKLTFECAVEFVGDASNKIQLEPDNKVYLLNGLNWSDYGFLPNQTITISYYVTILESPVFITASFIIEELLGDLMLLDSTVSTTPLIMPSQTGESDYIYDVFIYADLRPQGIEFSYGQITNEDFDSTALNSIIDGTIAQFKAINTDIIGIGASQTLLQTGNRSGMSIKNPIITYVNKIGTHTYKYFIELEFMLSSFFETLNDLENRIKPSWLDDINCLTDNFFIKGYPIWNNPNSYVKNDMSLTKKLGNTGWFDENFNGYDNHFTIDSHEYLTLANQPITSLDYASATKVKSVISGITNLGVSSKFQFGLLWITNDTTIYKTNTNQFHENLKLCHTKNGSYSDFFPISVSFDTNTYIGYSIDNAHIDVSDIKFSQLGLDIAQFEATFTPTSEFATLFESLNETDRKFILWVSVADSSLDTNYSDRVSILLDFNTYQKFIPPAGPYDNVTHTYYEHPESDGDLILHANDYVVSYVEDDFLVKLNFPKLLSENRIFKKFILKLDAEVTPGEYYNLQTYIIDVSNFVIDVDGVQQIDFDNSRGFKLESGNNKNFVKAFINNITLTQINYRILFAFKVRWEDWIQRNGVPVEFYDNSLLNDGFNNDWFHYSNLPGSLYFSLEIENELDGELILNRNVLEFAPTYDYDSNPCLIKTHNFYNHSDNTSLYVGIDPESGKPLNAILNNEYTRIEIDYTLDDPCGGYNSATLQALMLFYSLNPETIFIYATICIEIDKGAGQFEFRQLSSKWGSESDNPLIPLAGEDGTKIELLPDNLTLRTSCLIDPNLLPSSARYKVTGRIKLSSKP